MYIDSQLKSEFEQFVAKEFTGKIAISNIDEERSQWFFVQAGTFLGKRLHYEFNQSHVELHIELDDSSELQQFLYKEISNNELKWKYWEKANHCCQLKRTVATKEELFEAFIRIRDIIEPIIERFEKSNKLNMIEKGDNCPKVRTVRIIDLLSKELAIPPYQRPYRWRAEKHVRQLLEDIHNEKSGGKPEYRIGSVILHNNNRKQLDIVDGQQRIITILLILKALGESNEKFELFKNIEFKNDDSKNNIVFNYKYIKDYFLSVDAEGRQLYKNFILNNCTVNEVEIFSLQEAFQMFDSQNVRGKSLEPEDLLKAYHLREMAINTEEEKMQSVITWEKSIAEGYLNKVIGNYLFRIRRWKKNKWNYFFTNDDIDEFKGVNPLVCIKEGYSYPYLLSGLHSSMSNYYKIDEPIINGKRFFDYVDFFIKTYKETQGFVNNEKNLKFYYAGSYRIGDKRLRNLYRIVLMCYLDKFGMDKCFKRFSKELYRWTYNKRLANTQIRYETILKMLKDDNGINPIELIDSWYRPNVYSFSKQIKALSNSEIVKKNNEIEECIKQISEENN